MFFHSLSAHFISFTYFFTIIFYKLNIILSKVHRTMVIASNFFEKLIKYAIFWEFSHFSHFRTKIWSVIIFLWVYFYFYWIDRMQSCNFDIKFIKIGSVVYKLCQSEWRVLSHLHTLKRISTSNSKFSKNSIKNLIFLIIIV